MTANTLRYAIIWNMAPHLTKSSSLLGPDAGSGSVSVAANHHQVNLKVPDREAERRSHLSQLVTFVLFPSERLEGDEDKCLSRGSQSERSSFHNPAAIRREITHTDLFTQPQGKCGCVCGCPNAAL